MPGFWSWMLRVSCTLLASLDIVGVSKWISVVKGFSQMLNRANVQKDCTNLTLTVLLVFCRNMSFLFTVVL